MRFTARVSACGGLLLCLLLAGRASSQETDHYHPQKTSSNAPPAEQRIDINHASLEKLMKVPGMTRGWAGRIVRFRPYRTKQDLEEDGVVPPEVYNRIVDYVIAHREKH